MKDFSGLAKDFLGTFWGLSMELFEDLALEESLGILVDLHISCGILGDLGES